MLPAVESRDEPSWWEERTDFLKLASERHKRAVLCLSHTLDTWKASRTQQDLKAEPQGMDGTFFESCMVPGVDQLGDVSCIPVVLDSSWDKTPNP